MRAAILGPTLRSAGQINLGVRGRICGKHQIPIGPWTTFATEFTILEMKKINTDGSRSQSHILVGYKIDADALRIHFTSSKTKKA